jgi:hypothetical protein
MEDKFEILMVIFIFIIFFGGIGFSIYEGQKQQENSNNVYTLLMQNELEFVDNFIETKYKKNSGSKTYYNIIYKENGEIKKVDLTLEQYYNVLEKYQKTIDKQE